MAETSLSRFDQMGQFLIGNEVRNFLEKPFLCFFGFMRWCRVPLKTPKGRFWSVPVPRQQCANKESSWLCFAHSVSSTDQQKEGTFIWHYHSYSDHHWSGTFFFSPLGFLHPITQPNPAALGVKLVFKIEFIHISKTSLGSVPSWRSEDNMVSYDTLYSLARF